METGNQFAINWSGILHPFPSDPMRGLPGDPEIWWAATALLGENHVEVGNVHVWIIIPSVYQPTGSSSSTLFNIRCLTTYYQSRMSMHIFDTWSGDRGKWVKQLVNNLVCFMVISQPWMLPSHMPWRASPVFHLPPEQLYTGKRAPTEKFPLCQDASSLDLWNNNSLGPSPGSQSAPTAWGSFNLAVFIPRPLQHLEELRQAIRRYEYLPPWPGSCQREGSTA